MEFWKRNFWWFCSNWCLCMLQTSKIQYRTIFITCVYLEKNYLIISNNFLNYTHFDFSTTSFKKLSIWFSCGVSVVCSLSNGCNFTKHSFILNCFFKTTTFCSQSRAFCLVLVLTTVYVKRWEILYALKRKSNNFSWKHEKQIEQSAFCSPHCPKPLNLSADVAQERSTNEKQNNEMTKKSYFFPLFATFCDQLVEINC